MYRRDADKTEVVPKYANLKFRESERGPIFKTERLCGMPRLVRMSIAASDNGCAMLVRDLKISACCYLANLVAAETGNSYRRHDFQL